MDAEEQLDYILNQSDHKSSGISNAPSSTKNKSSSDLTYLNASGEIAYPNYTMIGPATVGSGRTLALTANTSANHTT
jgi:hypothetical protein